MTKPARRPFRDLAERLPIIGPVIRRWRRTSERERRRSIASPPTDVAPADIAAAKPIPAARVSHPSPPKDVTAPTLGLTAVDPRVVFAFWRIPDELGGRWRDFASDALVLRLYDDNHPGAPPVFQRAVPRRDGSAHVELRPGEPGRRARQVRAELGSECGDRFAVLADSGVVELPPLEPAAFAPPRFGRVRTSARPSRSRVQHGRAEAVLSAAPAHGSSASGREMARSVATERRPIAVDASTPAGIRRGFEPVALDRTWSSGAWREARAEELAPSWSSFGRALPSSR